MRLLIPAWAAESNVGSARRVLLGASGHGDRSLISSCVEAEPLTSLLVRCSLGSAQAKFQIQLMNKTFSIASTAAGLLWSLTCASAQTPTKPTNSVSLGQSHFVSFGTNRIHYITAGK